MEQQEAEENEYLTPITQSKKEELLRLESAGKTPRRVKVYLLNGDDWIDNGTGFCVGEIDEETKMPYFLVRKESKMDEIILKSNLEGSIQYQRQQDTLIVWTDPSGSDLALSFQETEGCADLCDFIIKVQQGNYSPNISLYYVISRLAEGDDITELITGPIRYPTTLPNEGNLERVLESLIQGANSQFTRTNISDYLVESKYFEKLMKIFEIAESSGNTTALHDLSSITKVMISYNEPSLLEEMLSSERNIYILAGILEYDSNSPGSKPEHRALLENRLFKTVIPVNESEIFKRDHSLTVLKEVVLTRFLDDQTASEFNSLIHANQIKVLEYLKSAGVLEKLFNIYEDEVDVELKRDGVKMLHQYVLIAKSIQKHDFFASVVKSGLFAMVKFALSDSEDRIRILGTELIVTIIEQNLASTSSSATEQAIDNSEPPIRPYLDENNPNNTLGNGSNEKEEIPENKSGLIAFGVSFLSTLCDIIADDEHIGLKYQAFEALKTLLDQSMLENVGDTFSEQLTYKSQVEERSLSQKDTEGSIEDKVDGANRCNQLKAFYMKVAPRLFAKLTAIGGSSGPVEPITRADSTLFSLLCEFIIFGASERDIADFKKFIIECKVLKGMVSLLNFECKKVLRLHVVRCLRSIVLLNDDELTDYLLENDILGGLFSYFESVSNQNDMCNSACLDFLNIIRTQSDAKNFGKRRNFKLIAEFLSKHHGQLLQSVSCMMIGPNLATLVENNFNETESLTLGICGETNLEQLGMHESFMRNGFKCHEDIEELSLGNIHRDASKSSGDDLLCVVSSRNGRRKSKEGPDEEDANAEHKSYTNSSKIGDKRPRDQHQTSDITITSVTKRRSYIETKEENCLEERLAEKTSTSRVHDSSPKDIHKPDGSADKKELATVQGTLIEASGHGGRDG
ncbi:PSY2 [Candida margitis]|uniref:PSY2 n=1 Tax=Candida margitis TaxID=1775924 RepID=UPI002226E999|nr:PSY2 [Candida margitis]KAI5949680.1 PSY2 [Candida margitis]